MPEYFDEKGEEVSDLLQSVDRWSAITLSSDLRQQQVRGHDTKTYGPSLMSQLSRPTDSTAPVWPRDCRQRHLQAAYSALAREMRLTAHGGQSGWAQLLDTARIGDEAGQSSSRPWHHVRL